VLAESPSSSVLILTLADDAESLVGGLGARARGYARNGAPQEWIAAALGAVAAGDTIFGADVAERLFQHLGADAPSGPVRSARRR
jgi:DNA-binding NarL/FixJ family response regulator